MIDNEKLLESAQALTDIDDSLISEAMEESPRRRFKAGYAAAAAAVLIFAAALIVLPRFIRGNGSEISAVAETKAPQNGDGLPEVTGEPLPTQPTYYSGNEKPYVYEYSSEEALLEAMRTGELNGVIDRYYRPADLPEGARFDTAVVTNSYVQLNYSARGENWSFTWLTAADPDEYMRKLEERTKGEWMGNIYVVNGMNAYFEQDGRVFPASVPKDAELEKVISFCYAEMVKM